MKPSCRTSPPPCPAIPRFPPSAALVRALGRALPVLAGIAILQLSFVSNAAAGAADGQYRFSTASGKLRIGGQTLTLSEDSLSGFGALKNGRAIVRNNRLKLYPKRAVGMIDRLLTSSGLSGVTVKVTGPSSILLKRRGSRFAGSSEPFVFDVSGSYQGQKFSGSMRWTYRVAIAGDNLVATAPISGSLEGVRLSGSISIICVKP